ncbi:MAG TPA: ABC transporter permease [Candidatus Methylacidiphilales bacterium]|nr:ABC transporter permease [Candidatus Methylacidiphilales bacterium]
MEKEKLKPESEKTLRERFGAGFLRRLWALSYKESLQTLRDPSSILVAFILPVLLIFIFGFAINLDSTRIRMGLVMEDMGPEAQRFAASLQGSPYLSIVRGTRKEMEQAVMEEKVRGFIVIMHDFSRKLDRPGEMAAMQVITDGTEPNIAVFVENYSRGAWQTWLGQRALARGEKMPPDIQLEPRYWFNPAAESRNYIIPGSITIIMTVVGALFTSLVVAREWERGTMEALLATPVTRTELLLSKLLPYYVLGISSLLLCVAVATFILKVPFRGSIPMLLVVSTFFLFSALGLGLLLSTLLRNQFNAAQAALNAGFLPAMMLSGFIYEISSMPHLLQYITCLLPARYFVTSIQTLFQAGDIHRLLWRDVFFLMLSSAFFIGLTAYHTKRRLDD